MTNGRSFGRSLFSAETVRFALRSCFQAQDLVWLAARVHSDSAEIIPLEPDQGLLVCTKWELSDYG